ncbi:MAG: PEP-CTERM sorting domain-containing protein [Planctomycetota bacterium]|nr:MAG: PEP-CTERM sorting domain-containing protein [Planctomycetota bacterium]
MLKRRSSISVGGRLATISVAFLLCAVLQPAFGQMTESALLLQQSPADGGIVAPGVGVHRLQLGSEVTLTAIAKPGYQFVYWMGDVSDPAANSTTVYLDGPKIVIAVFEQAEFEFLAVEAASRIRPGGGLFRSFSQPAQTGFGGPGGRRFSGPRWPINGDNGDNGDDEPGEEFPVPEGEDFPVPEVPEPATVLLLGLGSLVLLRKRRA